MFKVQISGRLDGKPRLKRVANRDVCNFTIRCRNEHDKCDSYVRCAIWGKKASRFFYGVNEEKEIFRELISKDVKCFIQIVPDAKKIDVGTLL